MDRKIFGLEPSKTDKFVLVPVPWDATASYHKGTSMGPQAVLKASPQIDLYDADFGDVSSLGIQMLTENPEIKEWNSQAINSNDILLTNTLSEKLNEWVFQTTKEQLSHGKIVGVVGGEHSVPFGAIQAVAENASNNYGVLHIDAHFDLRDSYEGYKHSHASILFNVMKSDFAPKHLVQVGLRDFCKDEINMAEGDNRISFFTQSKLSDELHAGANWRSICESMITPLPDQVYLTIDIDGFDPTLCPGTGTPVPGGLSFEQFATLLKVLVNSGRKIIGFDLVEVAPQSGDNEWNGNVGMRVLYKLIGATAKSQGL